MNPRITVLDIFHNGFNEDEVESIRILLQARNGHLENIYNIDIIDGRTYIGDKYTSHYSQKGTVGMIANFNNFQ